MTGHVIYDQPDEDYRAAPGVNQSALKHLLDCPARYRYETTHRVEKREWDFGTGVHSELLGTGQPITVLDFPDRRSKAYKDAEKAAREAGTVPLLPDQWDAIQAAIAEVHAHPIAGPLLTRPGDAEVSIYWTDEATGVDCKGRIDWVTITPDGTHWLVDGKTVGRTARPERFGKIAADYGYNLQAAFYRDGYIAATGVEFDQVEWLNVLIESAPPHLVSVTTFDAEALNAGRARYGRALDLLVECRTTGQWPGYTQTEAYEVSLPYYALEA